MKFTTEALRTLRKLIKNSVNFVPPWLKMQKYYRVYVASPYGGVVRVYGDHNTARWSVLSSQRVLRHY